MPISLPSTKAALSAYYVLAPAEASSNLAKYDGIRYGVRSSSETQPDQTPTSPLYSRTRGAGFGDEVKRRILLGTYSLSSAGMNNYFIQAQKVRRLVQQEFDSVFRFPNALHTNTITLPSETGVDFIICPTAPTPPPRLLDLKYSTPFDAYMNDVFTVPASLAGLPAISVPAPPAPESRHTDYANVGIQVIGQYGDDEALIRFVGMEMQATNKEVRHYTRWRKKRFL